MEPAPRRAAVGAGLAAIYLIWGSTYLVIAVGVAEIPPLLMAALRFIPAGAVLYAWSRLRGAPPPSPSAWLWACVTGVLMLTIGNGVLSFVETRMPSGVAALIVATVPLWLVALQAAQERRRPALRVLAAIAVGLGGVALLSGEEAGWKGGLEPLYVLLVVAGSFSWALGSLVARNRLAIPVTQASGLQMLTGGTVLLLLSLARGEPQGWDPGTASAKAWLAVLYLSLLGSIVALTTYGWLLKVSTPSLVGTYGFVNPVVAVLLGALILDEPLTWQTLGAGLLIVAAVALIVLENARSRPGGTRMADAAVADAK